MAAHTDVKQFLPGFPSPDGRIREARGTFRHEDRMSDAAQAPAAGARPASRDTAIDLLKIMAIFGVLVIHAFAPFFDGGRNPAPEVWWLCYAVQSCIRFCVPVFVMCSGAMLLSGTKDMLPLAFYKKRLPKLLLPLLVWSVVYYVYKIGPEHLFSHASLEDFLAQLLTAKIIGNFWFLYMLLGVYLSAPFLQILLHATTRSQQWLFVGLSLGLPGFVLLWQPLLALRFGVEYSIFSSYVGYFVLGHLLQTAEPAQRKGRLLLFSLYLAMVLLTFFCQWSVQQRSSAYQFIFLEYTMLNIAVMSAAVFMLLRSVPLPGSPKWRNRIATVGKATYGIYLVHILAVFYLRLGIFGVPIVSTDFPPFLGVLIVAVGGFVLSLTMVLLLAKIPLLRKTVGY